MRKVLFVVLSVFLHCIGAKAQITYTNYLDSTCEWRYFFDDGGTPNRRLFKTMYLDGDTLIGGNYYYRQKTRFRYASSGYFFVAGFFLGKDVFLREDSNLNFITVTITNGVVVQDTIFKFDSIIHLKYNDTIPNSRYTKYNNSGNPYYQRCAVASKDSFYLGTRKLLSVSPFNDPYGMFGYYLGIIEGIGRPYQQDVESVCTFGIHSPTDNLLYYNKQNSQLIFSSYIHIDSFPLPIRTNKYTSLPLKLLSFTAKQQTPNSVALNWQTANEVNVSHINIQRSNNGKNFENIGRVNAGGVSSYSFLDNKLPITNDKLTLYYRLEIVDKDGSKMYSEIRNLESGISNVGISIYPNPAKDVVRIECAGAKKLLIIDYLGRTVYQTTVNGQPLTVNCKQLVKGVYIVKAMMNNGEIKNEKLIVE